jgi:hypothetical protein
MTMTPPHSHPAPPGRMCRWVAGTAPAIGCRRRCCYCCLLQAPPAGLLPPCHAVDPVATAAARQIPGFGSCLPMQQLGQLPARVKPSSLLVAPSPGGGACVAHKPITVYSLSSNGFNPHLGGATCGQSPTCTTNTYTQQTHNRSRPQLLLVSLPATGPCLSAASPLHTHSSPPFPAHPELLLPRRSRCSRGVNDSVTQSLAYPPSLQAP